MKLFPILTFLMMIFTSCSSPDSNAHKFLVALNHHEFETAIDFVTENSKPVLYELINNQTQQIPQVEITIKDCVAANEKDTHVVCMYSVNSNGTYFEKKLYLLKENNVWRVDLTQSVE